MTITQEEEQTPLLLRHRTMTREETWWTPIRRFFLNIWRWVTGDCTDHDQHMQHIADGDPFEMILTTKRRNGEPVCLAAKMDTGAAANFMSDELCESLGMNDQLIPASEEDQHRFTDYDGSPLKVKGILKLPYTAGKRNWYYEDDMAARFYVVIIEEDPWDIILGRDALWHMHALTIDPAYNVKPKHEVITKKGDGKGTAAPIGFGKTIMHASGGGGTFNPLSL
ncbi:hypothetical protein H2201_002646 [Coniosporium apollinis]|uniref:Peptidase A2 domain-containing protein n=1 Tax=Coniosporium apollinis TaxID=61459 RepID=A0ABQ9NXL2_9PEZI|nr:hypothetical protein H2201_002646 [Coniosporium apollinis]